MLCQILTEQGQTEKVLEREEGWEIALTKALETIAQEEDVCEMPTEIFPKTE